MFLAMREVSKFYGKQAAVESLNLHVEKGELLCILGPSGCGKSTTIGMIGGFIKPTQGQIILENVNITSHSPDVRPTCTVFQSYALFPHMSVLKNVIYGLKFRGISKKEAVWEGERILETVGLLHLRDRKVTILSGGEQQRVALVRALILKPKVLLLDEPLSNLDAKLRFSLRREIKQVHERTGVTTLYVTHDQEEALALSDRMVVMNNGRIEQIGTPEDIYSRPANAFVAAFLGRANTIQHQGTSIMVRPEDMVITDGPGKLEGRVVQRMFSGPITTYFVDVNRDRLLEVDILGRDGVGPQVGDKVSINWRREMRVGE